MADTVGIVGAGVLGRLVALQLRAAGWETTLFDKDAREGRASCSWVGAGMIPPWTEMEEAEPLIAEMGVTSLALWPAIISQLPRPVFFQKNGSLVVAHRQDLRDLEMFKTRIRPKLTEPGLMSELDGLGVARLEPELGERFQQGVFFPEEGQLEPRDLLPALGEALLASGVVWRDQTLVCEIKPHLVVAEKGRYRFNQVVDARGLGARPDSPQLRGVRGELARIYAPEVRLNRLVRLIHPRYPLYIIPRPHQHYLIGATSIESASMAPVTVKSGLELLSALYSLHPGFGEAQILELAVQCRPAFPDNLPRIQVKPGLIRANGLYRHGYLTGPAFAEKVVQTVLNQAHCASEVQHVGS